MILCKTMYTQHPVFKLMLGMLFARVTLLPYVQHLYKTFQSRDTAPFAGRSLVGAADVVVSYMHRLF